MKKVMTGILALALALSMGATAFAADENGTIDQDDTDKTGNTSVTYTVDPSFTVTIPPTVKINGDAVTVSVEKVKVEYNRQVVVKLTGINEIEEQEGDTSFTVKTSEGASLPYTVTAGNQDQKVSKDDIILTVNPGSAKDNEGASGSIDLKFTLDEGDIRYAGEYKGTVTFTVSVETTTGSETLE